jgi:hypothetical protein
VIPGRQKRTIAWNTVTDDKLVRTELDPWSIPTENELDDLLEVSPTRPPVRWGSSYMWKHRDWWTTSDYGKYRFSAASAAIRFLSSTSLQTRLQLRNMLIHEDHYSVASPARHTIGLIPFCQENPSLRITRQVSVWRNLLHTFWAPWTYERRNPFTAKQFSENVAEWMVEAGALVSKGMPAGQFTLMLDADPAPAQATKIFNEVVQCSAAFQQAALRTSIDFGFADEPYMHQRFYKESGFAYLKHTFPENLRDLVKNPRSGTIQCNFDPGTTQSVNGLIAEHPDFCSCLWHSEWSQLRKKTITLEAPLPSWQELTLERMMDSWVAVRQEGDIGYEHYNNRLDHGISEFEEEGDAREDDDDDDDDEDDDDDDEANSDWVWDGSDYESE